MGPFEFVLCIIVIAVGVPVIGSFLLSYQKEKLKLRARELEVLGSETAERAAQYAAHNERLEARVQVLERIVTDKGLGLADEIEKLRDLRTN